jgi:two-component sensor histidine kinase
VARALSGGVARFSADCPTAKGTPKHWDVIVSPVHGSAGEITHLLSISRDVTREVQLAGERALVARELAHRIKNLLAVVDGIVGMSARTATDTKSFADNLRARLGGLARSVAYIYQGGALAPTDTKGRTVHGLIHELMQPYTTETKANITIEGDDLPVCEDAITPLALVFNELATNALKYGALKLPNGSLSITTKSENHTYSVRWIEASDAAVTAPINGGFGTILVDRTVKLQLDGTLKRHWSGRGLDFGFSVPQSRLT